MHTFFATLLTAAAVLAAPKDAAPPIGVLPIRVLIVTGYDHPAHKWRQTAPAVRQVLEKDKRFEVRIVEDPKFLGSAALADYDVILLHFMDWKRPGPGKKALANLGKTIEQGKGLFILHFACGAFGDYPEFEKLAGRIWDKKSGHDPYGPFRVEICKTDHPAVQGMKSFQTADELYTCLTGDRPVDLLAVARSKVTKKDHPMAFAFSYGKGRVFHTPLGHDVKAITNPGTAELIRRGCAWAAGR